MVEGGGSIAVQVVVLSQSSLQAGLPPSCEQPCGERR